jgi:hypothetical protein
MSSAEAAIAGDRTDRFELEQPNGAHSNGVPIDLSELKFPSGAEARASRQIASNCSTDRPFVSLVIRMTSIEPDVAAACAAFRGASAVMTVAPKRAKMMASKTAVAMTV